MAAIAAGVLVVIAGFLVYNYFSRVGQPGKVGTGEEVSLSEEGLTLPRPEELTGEEGAVAGEVAEGTATNEAAEETTEAETTTPETAATTEAWTANDLAPNSIGDGSYTVQRGDTLWEIAEARYGSGFEWTRLLEANKDAVGFLPDGSQALIEVGQTLVLPS
jgi:nucleoid-associated protein YgaU